MVLYPLPSGERCKGSASPIPAWRAVEKKQKQTAQDWWLITQADHAVLAGDLAARLDFRTIPALSSPLTRAIALHDAGWAQFDDVAIATTGHGFPPVSFLDITPAQFLIAWTNSINAAESTSAVGGIIVSEHFSRLARGRLASRIDSVDHMQHIEEFLGNESLRQGRLRIGIHESASQLEVLTDVLQFCDLVSLYLCCGADEPVEFPQRFCESQVSVIREDDVFLFTPSVFGRGGALGISARRYPAGAAATLPFLLG